MAALLLFSAGILNAQYFSRNKPTYKDFRFSILQTPHFELYHYLENDSLSKSLSRWSEEWYVMHRKIFSDSFLIRNPLIIYENHADFQQTNTISDLLGEGTGGVTESIKNRVIMPVAPTIAQTDHVLGHEMVHAFQFRMLTDPLGDTSLSIRNLPLWMVEGMAEYLSIGSVDAHTAMWMRDALSHDDFPTIKKLSNSSEYFPYRFGQAFWAMVAKTWGDTVIMPIFKETARSGYDKAFRKVLGMSAENLSTLWRSATETHFGPLLEDSSKSLTGRKIISDKNAGDMNISPSLSPDGRYIAFFSEKNVFTLDLYLADARTGKIIKKLSSVVRNNDIDDFSFIESAGTWSPDGQRFAFVVYSEGINKLAILDVGRAKITDNIAIPGVASLSCPAWSPDGTGILVSGMVSGISDLYLYNLENGSVRQLTRDFWSNIHPAWSPDGRYIAYATERVNDNGNGKKYSFDLVMLDTQNSVISRPEIFPGADNMNPVFSPDGRSLYFVSDASGIRNIYSYDLNTGAVYRLTDCLTGISGITMYAPAISISRMTDLIAYSCFDDTKYLIYSAGAGDFEKTAVDPLTVSLDAATLPPLHHVAVNIVDSSLYNRFDDDILPPDSIRNRKCRSKLQLDEISNAVESDVTAGRYGATMAGSVSMSFSDMLGNKQLFSSLSLNGEVYDFGAQLAYVNQKGKFKWGTAVSHIPNRYGSIGLIPDTIQYEGESLLVSNLAMDYLRMFEDNVSVFGYYPISVIRRLEGGISGSWYYYRLDRYNNYYTLDGQYITASKTRLDAPGGFNLQQIDLAYVEDNSFFGTTAPMLGHRARFQLAKYFGTFGFYSALVDYRKYFFVKPVSLALRLYHYGRYGKRAETDRISPLYMGYSWLIRGYENKNIYNTNLDSDTLVFDVDILTGSRLVLANAELRLPVTGPKSLALIKSGWIGTDLNLFFDGGLAWDSQHKPSMQWKAEYGKRSPVFSTGISLRLNLLGYIVVEPYYVIPFQNGGFSNGHMGLNFTAGW